MNTILNKVLDTEFEHLTKSQRDLIVAEITSTTSKWTGTPDAMEQHGLVLQLERSKPEMFTVLPTNSEAFAA